MPQPALAEFATEQGCTVRVIPRRFMDDYSLLHTAGPDDVVLTFRMPGKVANIPLSPVDRAALRAALEEKS